MGYLVTERVFAGFKVEANSARLFRVALPSRSTITKFRIYQMNGAALAFKAALYSTDTFDGDFNTEDTKTINEAYFSASLSDAGPNEGPGGKGPVHPDSYLVLDWLTASNGKIVYSADQTPGGCGVDFYNHDIVDPTISVDRNRRLIYLAIQVPTGPAALYEFSGVLGCREIV